MRILAATPYYEPEGGGLERYAHHILRRLGARGHEVHAMAFTGGRPGVEERANVTVERFRPLMRLGNTPIHPAFRSRAIHAIREFRPDVVLGHTPVPFAAEMAYLAARREDVPFVTTYHAGRLRGGSVTRGGLAALDRATLERRMLRGSARIIAVGPYVRDHALQAQRHRVTIVPPGVDSSLLSPEVPARGFGVLFVAPLSRSYRWKGVDVLWDAFRLVRRRAPEAYLTLVGDGDRFQEFARKAGALDGAVRLLGRVSDDELASEYRRAAVVVLPSTTDAESFGMVLAEANACGRPVVGSRIGGIPDFVRDGDNGLLARPGDAADLAEKILHILEEPARAREMGRRGRERVRAEHDWNDLAVATERLLRGAAGRGSASEAIVVSRFEVRQAA